MTTHHDFAVQIVETWQIHCRIQIFLLNGIESDALADAPAGKGRTVADHFGHMHNVRLMWLKASAPARLEGLTKIEKSNGINQEALTQALEASGHAIAALLEQAVAEGGQIKGFKPHAVALLGYLISHESYHAGKIDMILRHAGHAVSDKVHYGMWEWGVR